MSKSEPDGPAERVRLEFSYHVSNTFLEHEIDRTGVRPARRWTASIDLREDVDDPALRKRLREAHAAYMRKDGLPTFRAPVNEIEALLPLVETWAGLDANRGPNVFEDDMAEWIAEHGSDRLRLGFKRGYKISSLYARERAEQEVRPAWVDTSNEFRFSERTAPTADALRLEGIARDTLSDIGAAELECRVVWMTNPPRDLEEALDESEELFEDQEAIVIRGYLGRYTLVIPVDSDLWNNDEDVQ